MKNFKIILIIFTNLGFVYPWPFQRNDKVTSKETSHTEKHDDFKYLLDDQKISIPTTKILKTTPSTISPRPIPRPIGKLIVFFVYLKRNNLSSKSPVISRLRLSWK